MVVTFSGKENWGMGGMGGHPMMNNGGDQVKTHYQDKDGDLDEKVWMREDIGGDGDLDGDKAINALMMI